MASLEYPVQVDIDPPASQSRLTVFFRILMFIPHAILLAILGLAQGVVTILAWFAIVIVGKYPAGMFGFSVNVLRWTTRANGYVYLLTGAYPPFSLQEEMGYPIRLSIDPALTGRNRITTFFRIFMIIPHAIVLYFVQILAQILILFSWFAALFTGKVPVGLHNLIAGYHRWNTRYTAYALLLTDEYPPFSMD